MKNLTYIHKSEFAAINLSRGRSQHRNQTTNKLFPVSPMKRSPNWLVH